MNHAFLGAIEVIGALWLLAGALISLAVCNVSGKASRAEESADIRATWDEAPANVAENKG